jgi:hypothetical protein
MVDFGRAKFTVWFWDMTEIVIMSAPGFFELILVVDFSPNLHYNTSMKRKIIESFCAALRGKNYEWENWKEIRKAW